MSKHKSFEHDAAYERRAKQWESYLLDGGPMPKLYERVPEVPMPEIPDAVYREALLDEAQRIKKDTKHA